MSIDYSKIPSPCYVLDEKLLRQNLQLIKNVAKEAGVEIILAFKGFAMWGVFPVIKEYIKGAASSGLHESRLAFEEFGCKAHTYCPAFKERDLDEILSYSSHITFNSLSQLERFLPLVQQSKNPVSVGLRVNHEFSEVETELYNPCAPGSRLGVTSDQLHGKLPIGVEGLHFHSLCESYPHDLEKSFESVGRKIWFTFTSGQMDQYGWRAFDDTKWLQYGLSDRYTKKV